MAERLFDNKFETPTARVKPTDLNDTNSKLIQVTASGQAELALRTLQSNNIFINGGSLATDEYVDATGTNDTVNVGSTDAVFDVDTYRCKTQLGAPDVLYTTADTTVSLSNLNGVRINMTSNGILQGIRVGSGVTGSTVYLRNSSGAIIATSTILNNFASFNFNLISGQTYTITAGTNNTSSVRETKENPGYPLNYSLYNVDAGIIFSNEADTSPTVNPAFIWNISEIYISSSLVYEDSVIVHDTNTLPINSETKAFCVHHEGNIETDTSVEYEVSDGTGTPEGNEVTNNTGAESELINPQSTNGGLKLLFTGLRTIKSFTKLSLCTATKAYLYNSNYVLLETVDFIGNNAIFSGTSVLSDGCFILMDNNGSNYNLPYDYNTSGAHTWTPPLIINEFTISGSINGSSVTTQIYGIDSFVSDTIILNTPISLPINPITNKSDVIERGSLTDTNNAIINCNLGTTDTAKTPTSSGFSIKRID